MIRLFDSISEFIIVCEVLNSSKTTLRAAVNGTDLLAQVHCASGTGTTI